MVSDYTPGYRVYKLFTRTQQMELEVQKTQHNNNQIPQHTRN